MTSAGRGIHETAVVDPAAQIGAHVSVGPYCVVGPQVVLNDGVRLESHVTVHGHTTVGAGSTIQSHVTLGALPQDLKYSGEPSHLVLGERCRVAEYALLSGGTAAGGGITSVGPGCFIMSHCHVAHDCILGEGVLLASGAALAGHVHVGDGARISGYSCVQQRVSIGSGAFLGGGSVLDHDLIPHGVAVGNRAQLLSINIRGLRRRQASATEQRMLLSAFRYLFDTGPSGYFPPLPLPPLPTLHERASQIDASQHPRLTELIHFILGHRAVSALQPPGGNASGAVEGAGMAESHAPLCLPPRRNELLPGATSSRVDASTYQ